MKNGLYFVVFMAGTAVGSLAAWQYAKKKYERIAQEEIDSVKKVFSRKKTEEPDKPQKSDVAAYKEKINKFGYTSNVNEDKSQERREETVMDKPYVIPPEEFGQFEDYETVSLTYYADSILTDDNNEIVEDVDGIVGFDSLNHFGEYEDDSVFVRNDRLKCDYEILLDKRAYKDV